MEFARKLVYLFRHLNENAAWQDLIRYVGHANIYIVLFAIIFAETGLVVTPFLPGDSLLFAIGAIAAREVGLSLPAVIGLLCVAAVLGDAVNYWIGYAVGPKIFRVDDPEPWKDSAANADARLEYARPEKKRGLASKLLNKKHLVRAQEFYDKYGGKTILLARFVPVVRTFAPFVAGIGRMNFLRFWLFNIAGGIAWVLACVLAGVYFGRFEFVKKHFELVLVAIVFISVLPMGIEILRARKGTEAAAAVETGGK
jgi:membrane-associated protein